MSYVEYQKMLGLDTKPQEQIPHVDFSWGKNGDKFEVYGTLYLHEGHPALAHCYIWDAGPFSFRDELINRLGQMGYHGEVEEVVGDSGHLTVFFKIPTDK